MNGPLATAGSKPRRSINTGIKLPARFATVMATNMEMPMITPKMKFCFQTPMTSAIVTPVTNPEITPVANSDKMVRNKFFSSSSCMPILRTATASDCVPALPDVPVIKVTNTERIDASEIKPSYWLIKVDVPIPKNNSVINHGNRLDAATKGFSDCSSTSTPAKPEKSLTASSSMTSMMSSTVMIPSNTLFSSTTGTARKS